MKILILLLAIFLPLGTFAATVSGEATIKIVKKGVTTTVKTPVKAKSSTGTTTSVPVKTTIKYIAGPKGTCYTTQKDKKTGKMIKKYFDKKFCTK